VNEGDGCDEVSSGMGLGSENGGADVGSVRGSGERGRGPRGDATRTREDELCWTWMRLLDGRRRDADTRERDRRWLR